MKAPKLSLVVVAGLALITGGCATEAINARIQEKSTVFGRLPAEVQKDIREGTIAPGYTADMVYMALGSPSKVKVKDTPDGKVGVWIYSNFYPAGYEAKDNGEKPEPVPVTSSFDRPGSSDYGFKKTEDQQMRLFAQSRTMGRVKIEIANASTFNDRSGAMQPLELPDMESAALYVIFYQGRVVDLKMTRG